MGTKFQHWDLVARNNIGYLEGCASKYVSRWDRKGAPVVDLEKAVHYCDKILESAEEFGYRPAGYADNDDLQCFFGENNITDYDAVIAIEKLCQWTQPVEIQIAKHRIENLLQRVRLSAL